MLSVVLKCISFTFGGKQEEFNIWIKLYLYRVVDSRSGVSSCSTSQLWVWVHLERSQTGPTNLCDLASDWRFAERVFTCFCVGTYWLYTWCCWWFKSEKTRDRETEGQTEKQTDRDRERQRVWHNKPQHDWQWIPLEWRKVWVWLEVVKGNEQKTGSGVGRT